MEDKEKIEQLQKEIENVKASWFRVIEERDTIKTELSMYKNLCKVQSELINNSK